jgi:hypothetical protein
MTQAGGCTDNACRRRPPNQSGSGVAALTVRSARAAGGTESGDRDAGSQRPLAGRSPLAKA